MCLVAVALTFFFAGFMAQPFMGNNSEFLVELMNCQIETQEDCSFVAMPDSAYTHIQFLYASHVK
jgi:hypothetical protein